MGSKLAKLRHEEPYFPSTAQQLISEVRQNIAPGVVMTWTRSPGLYNLIIGERPRVNSSA